MGLFHKGLKGQVVWVSNKKLGLPNFNRGSHMLLVTKDHFGLIDGRVITSIEKNGVYKPKKVKMIENGDLFPIPMNMSNLPHFSSVTVNVFKDIEKTLVKPIGNNVFIDPKIKKLRWK